jgi:hypothetical protein
MHQDDIKNSDWEHLISRLFEKPKPEPHQCKQPVEKKCSKCLQTLKEEKNKESEKVREAQVMDSRKWIEFGKMWNAMETEGYQLTLETYPDTEGIEPNEYEVEVWNLAGVRNYNEFSQSYGPFLSPYSAMKSAYFRIYLGMKEYEEIDFDLDEETLAKVTRMADANGITIDEVVTEILVSALGKHK